MAYLKKTISRGKEYFALVTKARVNGKLVEVERFNIGSRERLVELLCERVPAEKTSCTDIVQVEFGSPWLAYRACKEAGLFDILKSLNTRDHTGPTVAQYVTLGVIAVLARRDAGVLAPDWCLGTALPGFEDFTEAGFSKDGFLAAIDMVPDKAMPRILGAVMGALPEEESKALEKDADNIASKLADPEIMSQLTARQERRYTLCCILSLACAKLIEATLAEAGLFMTAKEAIASMDSLRMIRFLKPPRQGHKDPEVLRERLTTPTDLQRQIMAAYGYGVSDKGILFKNTPASV